MDMTNRIDRATQPSRAWGATLATLLALLLWIPCSVALAQADESEDEAEEEVELAEEDLECLSCHDKPGLETKLESGEVLSLHISTAGYIASMHRDNSCADCHSEIDTETHGKDEGPAVTSKRELGVSMRDVCVDCHKKKYKEYGDSVHAVLVEQGSETAPMCADCHNPHTVKSWEVSDQEAAMPCGKCHQDIFKASARDVHGRARKANEEAAPVCAGCHEAHGVKAASLGTIMMDTCISCHEDSLATHKIWLPHAQRHFDSISCAACHAPDAQRRVNLRLFQVTGNGSEQMSEQTGVPRFLQRILATDAKEAGLDDKELWNLLEKFKKDSDGRKAVLRGRLEVSSGVEAHQLSDKSRALGDCRACHEAGSEPFQSVTLTIAGPDGRPLRHEVQKQVLGSLLSVNSVQGFYVLGSTRIKLLDYLLVLVVLAGIGGPLAHMTMKWVFRRSRGAHSPAQLPPGDRRDGDDHQK